MKYLLIFIISYVLLSLLVGIIGNEFRFMSQFSLLIRLGGSLVITLASLYTRQD